MNQLYYFTSLDTLDKILTNGTLRARNSSYMNDRDEVVFGLQVLKHIASAQSTSLVGGSLEDAVNSAVSLVTLTESPFLIICLTKNDPMAQTSLTQWAMYAGENGVAIGMNLPSSNHESPELDPGVYWAKEVSDTLPHNPIGVIKLPEQNPPQRVRYFTEKYSEKFRGPSFEIPSAYSPLEFKQFLLGQAITIKHDAFSQENEYRLVFGSNQKRQRPLVGHFLKDGLLSPFMDILYCPEDEIVWKSLEGGHREVDDKKSLFGWPITTVTVGPGDRQDRTFENLRTYLNQRYLATRPLKLKDWKKNLEICLDLWCEDKSLEERCRMKEELARKIRVLLAPALRARVREPQKLVMALDAVEGTIQFYCDKYNLEQSVRMTCDITRHGVLLQKSHLSYLYSKS